MKSPLVEVRVDSSPDAIADVHGTIQDLRQIPTGAVKALYASHVLEHVHWHELYGVMKELQRVVKADGLAIVAVPNLEFIADWLKGDGILKTVYTAAPGETTPLDMIYGFRPFVASGMKGMEHKTGFNPYLLERVFRESGWAHVLIVDQGTEITAVASQQPIPYDYRQFLGL